MERKVAVIFRGAANSIPHMEAIVEATGRVIFPEQTPEIAYISVEVHIAGAEVRIDYTAEITGSL